MLDWLTWPADLLLNAAAPVANWFLNKDDPNFLIAQMMIAALLLAAIVALIVYWQSLVEYCRSRLKNLRIKPPS